MGLSSFFYKQVLVRLQASKNGGTGAGGHQFFAKSAPQDLKELHTAGAKMGTSIQGVGNDFIAVAHKKFGIYEIGVIGCMGEI